VFTIGLIGSIIVLKITLDAIDPIRKNALISSFYGLAISSFIPKLIFVVVITILYFTNYIFSSRESLILVPAIGLLSGFLPFFVIIYGTFNAIYKFKVHHHIIKCRTLPKSFNGLKIVQLSDIHLGSFNYRYNTLNRAIQKVNHLQPDYIFITGDLVNNYAWELKGWDSVFNKLKSTKGKYAILGNHDYGDYSEWDSIEAKQDNFESIKKFYKNVDFKLLLNEAEIITENNEQIAIIGVENWGKPPFKQYGDLKKAMKKVKAIPFKILLTHDPTHWTEKVIHKTNISLTFSGHTHGMQAGIQYKTLQWSPIKYKYKYWAGLYKIGEQFLYVNRGLGWLGFPARIGMRPEITCMELKSTI
jgi:predicted MPP superfamily phosphohydrolase